MKIKIKIILFILVTSLLATTAALADGSFQINWWTVDNGGGTIQSADGQYTLSGTIGQWDAGFTAGGEYALNGGFWGKMKSSLQEFLIHLPLILR